MRINLRDPYQVLLDNVFETDGKDDRMSLEALKNFETGCWK